MNCDGPSFMVDQSDGVEWMTDAKIRHVSVIGAGLHWRSMFLRTSAGNSEIRIVMIIERWR